MADSAVAVTAGSGTNIDTRTEGTNGNHRQVIVIGDPATNAAVATVTDGPAADTDYALVVTQHPDGVNANGEATMANSAPVVIASDQSAVAVKTNGSAHVVSVIPTVTAGAYTADDVLGAEMTITAAARASGIGGVITGVTMTAEGAAAANDVEVLIFKSDPAGTYSDNGALAVTDADTYLLLGSFMLDSAVDTGDGTLLQSSRAPLPYICSGSANLFALAVNRGPMTPDATDALQFNFHLLRD